MLEDDKPPVKKVGRLSGIRILSFAEVIMLTSFREKFWKAMRQRKPRMIVKP